MDMDDGWYNGWWMIWWMMVVQKKNRVIYNDHSRSPYTKHPWDDKKKSLENLTVKPQRQNPVLDLSSLSRPCCSPTTALHWRGRSTGHRWRDPLAKPGQEWKQVGRWHPHPFLNPMNVVNQTKTCSIMYLMIVDKQCWMDVTGVWCNVVKLLKLAKLRAHACAAGDRRRTHLVGIRELERLWGNGNEVGQGGHWAS